MRTVYEYLTRQLLANGSSSRAGDICPPTHPRIRFLKILEDTARIARRVLGAAHPVTAEIEPYLRDARAALAARETPEAEKLAQDASRTARAKLAQERSELADAMAAMTTG